MRNTLTITLKELKSFLALPMAYVVTGIFLLLTGFLFGTSSSTYYETSIRGLWEFWGILLLLLLVSVLTMRLLAEEKKMGTLELLLTAPVRDSEVIVGKFLSSLGVFTAMLALTLYYPLLLWIFGDPDWGPIATTYLGLFLLGCTSLAVGLFASSLTANQIVAAAVSGGILFLLWFVGMLAGFLPEAMQEVVSYLSFYYHVSDFMQGVIDTRGVVYYMSITVLFLFLSIRSLESSRLG